MARHPLVLIVDYDPKNIRTLTDLFRSHGYFVESASDGMAALSSFKAHKPDLVFLEAMIPKKHGFEVCQEIKKLPQGKSTPVIIMTGVYKGRKYRSQAMHVHGCDEYVEKPCAPESILEMAMRFVPVPAGNALAAAAAGPERLGEVIPFPAGRSGPAPGEDADEAAREIMLRLDEIMPDSSIFGAPPPQSVTAQAISSAAPAADLRAGPASSPLAEEDEVYEIEMEEQVAEVPREAAAAPQVELNAPPSAVSPRPPTAGSPQPPSDGSPQAAPAAVRRQAKRLQTEQAGQRLLEIIPPPKPKSSLLLVVIVSAVIVVAAVGLYFLSQI